MPQFYFDVQNNGRFHRDDEGVDLRDIDAAVEEAFAVLPEIAHRPVDSPGVEITTTVRDDHDRSIFRAKLAVSSEWLIDRRIRMVADND